jgi:GT2 family glycosyltransferase
MGKDLGYAYKQYMSLVPDGDWALFLDQDISFLTNTKWFRLCEEAIEKKPDAGMFCAKTTRLRRTRSKWQMVGDGNCHDMKELRRLGLETHEKYGCSLREVTTTEQRNDGRPNSGFFILINKNIWKEIELYIPHRLISTDYAIHRAVQSLGYKIYLIEGLVLYHWWRGKKI